MAEQLRGNIEIDDRGDVLIARLDGGPLGLWGFESLPDTPTRVAVGDCLGGGRHHDKSSTPVLVPRRRDQIGLGGCRRTSRILSGNLENRLVHSRRESIRAS